MFESQPTCSMAAAEQDVPVSNSNLEQSLVHLQSFMVKKGLMTEDELQEFMVSEEQPKNPATLSGGTEKSSKGKKDLQHTPKSHADVALNCHNSPSKVTVYQRAVPSVVADKVGQFLQQVRQKISSSSDDMDTSDEADIPLTDGLILTDNFISGQAL